jgi:hypothetical protein
MCNAWNHPTGCGCGFGAGFGQPSHPGGNTTYPPVGRYASFTIPNAACPVCKAPVFFYQSPEGGRVFFDDLGPPWPKHPCIDNGEKPWALAQGRTPAVKLREKPRHVPKWQVAHWIPVEVRRVQHKILDDPRYPTLRTLHWRATLVQVELIFDPPRYGVVRKFLLHGLRRMNLDLPVMVRLDANRSDVVEVTWFDPGSTIPNTEPVVMSVAPPRVVTRVKRVLPARPRRR